MPRTAAWVGLDLGTSSLKVLAVGRHGSLLDEHETDLPVQRPAPHRVEADPASWTRAVDAALADLDSRFDLRGLSVTGQMHGTVLLDDRSEPVRPAVLWPDSRSQSLRARWENLPPATLGRLGNPWSPGMTGPVLAWLAEHEPAVADRAAHVVLPKDHVRGHLTGEPARTDPSDASGTLLWDVTAHGWTSRVDDLVPARLLPDVSPSTDVAGTWHGAAVHVGGGDTPVSLLTLEAAVGPWRPGDVVVNLGTGAQVIVPSAATPGGSGWPDVHTYADAHDSLYAMVAAQNAGLALSWARDRLRLDWARFSELVGRSAPGAEGVVFSPFVNAERGGLDTQVPVGWTPDPPTTAAAARAAAEAQAFLVRRSWELLAPDARRVITVGGGVRDPWVRQLLADTLGHPVHHVPMRSAAAAGAVLLASGPLLAGVTGPTTVTEPAYSPALDEAYARWRTHCYVGADPA